MISKISPCPSLPTNRRCFKQEGVKHIPTQIPKEPEKTPPLSGRAKINPQYTDALFMKGHILYDLKRTALALRCFEQVLEVEPANYDAWYFQAIVQDELGRKKKAGISFKKFLGLAPDNQDMEAGIKYVLQRIEELGE